MQRQASLKTIFTTLFYLQWHYYFQPLLQQDQQIYYLRKIRRYYNQFEWSYNIFLSFLGNKSAEPVKEEVESTNAVPDKKEL